MEINETEYPIFGTICYGPEPQIETFVLVKTSDDIPNLDALKLRHRFNSHRRYKCFSMFSTPEYFEALNKRLNENPDAFGEWIEEVSKTNKDFKFVEL